MRHVREPRPIFRKWDGTRLPCKVASAVAYVIHSRKDGTAADKTRHRSPMCVPGLESGRGADNDV